MTQVEGSLAGRVVAVTGAASGLGRVIAERVSSFGAKVAMIDRDAERLDAAVDTVNAAGGRALGLVVDIADEAQVADAADRIRAELGPCRGLVNCAGIIRWDDLATLELADWSLVMDVNVTGTFLCIKHLGAHMLDGAGGSIVTIGSVAGSNPQGFSGAYSPSKAAAVMLAKQVGIEWGVYGVRGNAVSPGIMQSPMAEAFLSDPAVFEARRGRVAENRIAGPEEVASVVTFLLSDASAYVSAQDIVVDGGLAAMSTRLLPRPGTPQQADDDRRGITY